MDVTAILSAVALGAALGFVFQRGRYCLNTAFRDIIYIKNFNLFRTYLLSLVVAMLGSNLLEEFGLIRLGQGRAEFAWLASAAGGYLFGIGMVMAGGCAAGTWYRVGEGFVGSWMAAFGFIAGAAATTSGVLHPVHDFLTGISTPIGSQGLDGLLGMNKWVIIAIFSIAAFIFISTAGRRYSPDGSAYQWWTTGILVGLIIAVSRFIAQKFTGTAAGISLVAPSEGLLRWTVTGEGLGWGVALLLGIPLGSFAGSRSAHEFSWRAPRAVTMVQQFAGGLIMGIGGALAGGCLIGHGLSGLSVLSVASLVSTVFMILGSWTMVYILFIKGPA